MKHYVYVYGSLRPGKGDKFYVPGVMYGMGGFPAVLLHRPKEGETEIPLVVTEKVAVTDAQLARLDNYEGYDPDDEQNSFYLRVPYKDGWIYEFNSTLSSDRVVPSGDWLEHTGKAVGHAFFSFLSEAEIVEVPCSGVAAPESVNV
jgi:gamma-glutamylcyclotransferase (GGCT)/AIG2-like uncharacterized protein YtfP